MSDEEKQENLTMSQRIDAFYRQSGGPNNPEINRILEEHLMNGKDHGIPGRREELKDAFSEIFLSDHSTRPIVMSLMQMGMTLKGQWETYLDAQRDAQRPDIDEIVDKLEKRLQKEQKEDRKQQQERTAL